MIFIRRSVAWQNAVLQAKWNTLTFFLTFTSQGRSPSFLYPILYNFRRSNVKRVSFNKVSLACWISTIRCTILCTFESMQNGYNYRHPSHFTNNWVRRVKSILLRVYVVFLLSWRGEMQEYFSSHKWGLSFFHASNHFWPNPLDLALVMNCRVDGG